MIYPLEVGMLDSSKMGRFKRWFDRSGIGRGQGLVELTVLFPILLILLSGLMEFGFLLNEYLDILDGAREAARFTSDSNPFQSSPACGGAKLPYEDPDFYLNTSNLAIQTMSPLSLNPVTDDIIISLFSVTRGSPPVVHARFPKDPCVRTVSGEWRIFNNHVSEFSTPDIVARLEPSAPNTGIVLVEIFYAYNQKFRLPWITAFVPDPIQVHAFSMMPLVAAEPTPTPIP